MGIEIFSLRVAVLARPQGGSIQLTSYCTTQKECNSLLRVGKEKGRKKEKRNHQDSNPGRFAPQKTTRIRTQDALPHRART